MPAEQGSNLMRIRHLAAASLILAAVAAAGPAGAATSGSTTTTFIVSGGALSITVPAGPVALGTAAPGGTITSQLGGVQVTDLRALLIASWGATVTSTSFTTGGGTPAETVPNTAVSYWSGLATATTGTATFTPGEATSTNAQALGTSQPAYSESAGVGDNSASWNPTLVVSVPAQAVAGTYTGTVTHSVA
jgi:hypothetical protein